MTRKIFGFSVSSENILLEHIHFGRNINVNSDRKVPLKLTPFETSEIVIMFDHDFTEKYYEIKYFGYMDILSIIGGLNASLGPIFGLFTPLFILNFLY